MYKKEMFRTAAAIMTLAVFLAGCSAPSIPGIENASDGSEAQEEAGENAVTQEPAPEGEEGAAEEASETPAPEEADQEKEEETPPAEEEEKPEEMLSYIETYATSVASPDPADHQSQNALALYQYLANNKDGLLPYHKRGIGIPKPQEGIIYKDMGVQENQNCTLITMRMKHRRMRWGSGANNLAKVMYRKENHELIETIDRYSDGLVINARLNEIVEALSAAKAPRTDGKGSPYTDLIRGHVPLLEAMRTASRRAFMQAFAN
jgi:hypothetical protein